MANCDPDLPFHGGSHTRSEFLKGLAAAGASLATIGALPAIAPAARAAVLNRDLDRISLQLAWLVNVQSAGDIVAARRHYLEHERLAVHLAPGGPTSNPITLVASGASLVGVTYTPQLILARSNGVPVKAFAAALQRNPLGYYSKKSSNIRSVKDWAGKTIGVAVGGEAQVAAILAANGMKVSDVQIRTVGYTVTPLLAGQVDIIGAWTINLEQIAPLNGDYNVQTLWGNGVRFPTNLYIAHEDTIASRPQDLARFVTAVARGWAYAVDNPRYAVSAVIDAASGLDAGLQLKELKLLRKYVFTNLTKQHGFGWMDSRHVNQMVDAYRQLNLLPHDVSTKDLLTLEILKRARPLKR